MDNVIDNVTCPHCGFSDSGRFCSHCGGALGPLHSSHQIAKSVLGPLYDYFSHYRYIVKPTLLTDEIRLNRFHPAKLLTFALAASALTLILLNVLAEPQTADLLLGAYGIPKLPIISEIAMAVVFVGLSPLLNAPIHFVLRRKTDVTIGKFIIATTILTALFLPFIALTVSAIEIIDLGLVFVSTTLVSWYVYIRTYMALYRKSVGIVIFAMVVSTLISATLSSVVFSVLVDSSSLPVTAAPAPE